MEQTTYYDLTAGQQLLLFSQTFTVHKQINNIFFLMLMDKALDFETLTKAIESAYEENDAFKLRFTKQNKRIRQYFAPVEKPNPIILDFTGKTQEEMDECLHKLARKPIKIINRPMTRVFLVKAWNGMNGIYFGVNHMILDAWGIFVFLQYVMEAYESMKNGAPRPKPLSPLEPMIQKDLAYKDSAQYQKDKEFWENEFNRRGEPLLTHINGPSVLEAYRRKKKNPDLRYAQTIGLRTAARHEILTVAKEDVEAIRAYCEANNISMQAVFMFGVRTALSKLNDRQDDIGFYATYARRGTLQEKRAGGSRVLTSVFRTIIKEDATFDQACREIFSYQTLIYRHAEINPVEVMGMEAKKFGRKGYFTGWNTTIFTFQPIKVALADGTQVYTKWYCNGAFSSLNYLTIMDDDGSGALRCYHEYQKRNIKAERIREFQNLMVQAIMLGVRNPSATVGEILDGMK